MHRTPTTSARPAARGMVFLALLGALLLLALAQAVPALGAAGLHRRPRSRQQQRQSRLPALRRQRPHRVRLRFSATGTLLDAAGDGR